MRKRKRSPWELSCIIGLPQFLCFIIIELFIAVRWGNEHLRGGFDITSPDDLKLPLAVAFLFWVYVVLNNLLWLKTTKPISFFTFLEKYRYEPLELSDRKRHSQYPDIPPELLSDRPDGFVLGKRGRKFVRVELNPSNIVNGLILGAPGCGKSVLLLTMLIYQLHRAELEEHYRKSKWLEVGRKRIESEKTNDAPDPITFYLTDIKPEMGRKSVILADSEEKTKVHYMDVQNRAFYGWNVYFAIRPDSTDDEILAELDVIARALIDEGKAEKNAFFYQHARILFKSILLYQIKLGNSFIQGLDYLLTGSLGDVISKTVEKIAGKQEYSLIYKLLSPYIGKEGEAFEGIELSLRQQLDIYNQQAVRYFLDNNPRKASPLDLESKISVIFGIQENKLEEYRSLLRLVTMQIKEHCIKRPEDSHMLCFIIDEAARIGIDWTSFLATSRSRKISTILAFQSRSQAEDIWGREKTKSLIELCRVIAILSCTDSDFARELGEWIGVYAETRHSDTQDRKGDRSSSTSYEDKKVLTQADIMQLQENKEVVAFVKGQYLRMDVDGARYYNIPELAEISNRCIEANDVLFDNRR